ncbi:MAG: succinate dehydrogenase/fumarate reductase iron-sulfur subunit [Acidobacteriota bacterium]|nr:succinate dehydrogenase/fumarate reductase iron-sulfur subunit [Acidobacteriota bacterium]
MPRRTFEVYRGTAAGGSLETFDVEVEPGMVVLDAVFRIQATDAPDLAVRWNCKAGKCGSCSCEVNGKPKLACMTRISDYAPEETITVTPMRAFPVIKDLVTDVSHNYRANEKIPRFTPRPRDADDGWRMYQYEVDRAQEMRKCIECFLCQDVCHVLRSHDKHAEFVGPAYLVRAAAYSMNPIDTVDRTGFLKEEGGIGYCNITKCCTEVCPEHITITDNAIIPLKELVVDRYYDPLKALVRLVRGGAKS